MAQRFGRSLAAMSSQALTLVGQLRGLSPEVVAAMRRWGFDPEVEAARLETARQAALDAAVLSASAAHDLGEVNVVCGKLAAEALDWAKGVRVVLRVVEFRADGPTRRLVGEVRRGLRLYQPRFSASVDQVPVALRRLALLRASLSGPHELLDAVAGQGDAIAVRLLPAAERQADLEHAAVTQTAVAKHTRDGLEAALRQIGRAWTVASEQAPGVPPPSGDV